MFMKEEVSQALPSDKDEMRKNVEIEMNGGSQQVEK